MSKNLTPENITQQAHGWITRSLAQGVHIELDGDWGRFQGIISGLPLAIREASIQAQTKVANIYRRKVIKNMKTNAFGYTLKQSYQFYKAKHGGDTSKVGYWTGKLAKNIITKTNRSGALVQVTVRDGVTYSEGDHGKKTGGTRDIKQIANMLEHGTSNMSAKPYFRDTYQQLGGKRYFQGVIARSLAYRLRMYYR